MELFLFAVGAVVFIGSVCGLVAAGRVGVLAHRLSVLERRLMLGHVAPPYLAASHAPVAYAGAMAGSPYAGATAGPPYGGAMAGPSYGGATVGPSHGRAMAGPPVGASHAPIAASPAAELGGATAEPPAGPSHAPGAASPSAGLAVSSPSRASSPATTRHAASAPVIAVAPAPAPAAPRSPDADWWHAFELRAGTRWITWLGAGALVIAAALFVKLAIERGWLGPVARLALGAAGGVGLLFAGRRAYRAEMRPLAHGLFGAGLGVLYVATYVAFASYGLIARELVFGAMIGVTVVGCAIAIRHDAQPVAVLALLGGLLTPVAASSGDGSREALFLYLLVLDLGALAIALVRRWRAIELIALVGTWVLFGGWVARAHAPGAAELAWLAVFLALFTVVPFGYQLWRRLAAEWDRSLFAFANAAAAIACAVEITGARRGAIGAAVLAMAAMYAVLDAVARRRIAGGDRAQLGFLTLAGLLATASVPLLLRGHAITIAWALEASALLALGFHDRRSSIRAGALLVLALAMVHGASRWPIHPLWFRPFANPAFAAALLVPLAAALFAWVHRALRERGDARDRWYGLAAALAGGAVVLALVHTEVEQWFALQGRRDVGFAVLSLVWSAGALIVLGAGARRASSSQPPVAVSTVSVVAALFGVGLCFAAYRAPAAPDALLALNLRFAGALLTATALAANAAVIARRDRDWGRVLWAAAVAAFGVAIGAETYLHYAPLDPLAAAGRRAQTALSIAWSGYAAILLAIGFVRRRRPFRLAGLGLLGLVAVKLLLVDLAGAPQAYRVLSFLLVGALMIAVSYAYHRLERRPGPPEE